MLNHTNTSFFVKKTRGLFLPNIGKFMAGTLRYGLRYYFIPSAWFNTKQLKFEQPTPILLFKTRFNVCSQSQRLPRHCVLPVLEYSSISHPCC